LVIFSCSDNIDSNETSKRKQDREFIEVKFGSENKKIFLNLPRIEDRVVEPKRNNISTAMELHIGGIDDTMFVTPTKIRTDKYENFYVLDNLAGAVKKFDKQGNFIVKYGSRGKGPGEFDNAFDFDVTSDGVVAILSPNLNKLAVFDDSEVIEYKPTDMSLSLCFTSSDEVVIFQMADMISKSPFRRINYKSKETFECVNLISADDLLDEGIGMLPFLIGKIMPFGSGKFVYLSQVTGYIVIYDDSGHIESSLKISGLRSSKINREKLNSNQLDKDVSAIRFPRITEYIYLEANIYNNKLYLLQNNYITDNGSVLIDVVDLNSNEYLYSIELIVSDIVSVYMTEEKIFVSKKDASVEIYSYELK